MHLTSLLDIVADALPDRTAVGPQGRGLTYQDLLQRAQAVSRDLRRREAERLVAVDVNSEAVPLGLFAAAVAGIPYVPVNYRLADAQLAAILERAAPGLAVVEPSVPPRFPDGIPGLSMTSRAEFLQADGARRPGGERRRGGPGRVALHQWHDGGAQGGRAAPSTPHELRVGDGRVPGGRARGRRVGQRPAVSHRRNRGRA